MIDYNIGLVYFLCFAKRKASKFTRLQLSEYYQISKQYKLFTFLSVDMEIVTPSVACTPFGCASGKL
jgi:hypothetical protein